MSADPVDCKSCVFAPPPLCRPCPAAGARGDAEAEGGGGPAERRAEGQSAGNNYHLQRGGGGKETLT